MGEIFSPPRLMSSLMRPVRVRKPSSSRKPWSPVWNQPPATHTFSAGWLAQRSRHYMAKLACLRPHALPNPATPSLHVRPQAVCRYSPTPFPYPPAELDKVQVTILAAPQESDRTDGACTCPCQLL